MEENPSVDYYIWQYLVRLLRGTFKDRNMSCAGQQSFVVKLCILNLIVSLNIGITQSLFSESVLRLSACTAFDFSRHLCPSWQSQYFQMCVRHISPSQFGLLLLNITFPEKMRTICPRKWKKKEANRKKKKNTRHPKAILLIISDSTYYQRCLLPDHR